MRCFGLLDSDNHSSKFGLAKVYSGNVSMCNVVN